MSSCLIIEAEPQPFLDGDAEETELDLPDTKIETHQPESKTPEYSPTEVPPLNLSSPTDESTPHNADTASPQLSGTPTDTDFQSTCGFSPKSLAVSARKSNTSIKKPNTRAPSTQRPATATDRGLSKIPKKNDTLKSASAVNPSKKIEKPPTKLAISKLPSRAPAVIKTPKPLMGKRALEIQFFNKQKRYNENKKEYADKQKAIVESHTVMVDLQKQLAKLGRTVTVEDIKLIQFGQVVPENMNTNTEKDREAIILMKDHMQRIPKGLADLSVIILGRQECMNDFLKEIAEIHPEQAKVKAKIEAWEEETAELKLSVLTLKTEAEARVNDMAETWYKLVGAKDVDIVILANNKIKEKEDLLENSKSKILELQKKLDEKRNLHERAMNELEIIRTEKDEKIKKLTTELENEKKISLDLKTRNNSTAQSMKSLRIKLNEAEAKLKDMENKNDDLSRRLKVSQDQLRQKESAWVREKEEMKKTMQNQDTLLTKLNKERQSFQIRLKETEKNTDANTNQNLNQEIEKLEEKVNMVNEELNITKKEKETIERKCKEIEEKLNQFVLDNPNMSSSDWSKSDLGQSPQSDLHSELLSAQKTIKNYENTIKNLEDEKSKWMEERTTLSDKFEKNYNLLQLQSQEEACNKYKKILEECEINLNQKSLEVAKLTAEIKHLKIRQDALEEQSENCPTSEVQKMLEENRKKYFDLTNKYIDNEQKLSSYKNTIEKQHKQMNEMENLLRVRDGLVNTIKLRKDELVKERDSLKKYCIDVRSMLTESKEELRLSSKMIKDLQDKVTEKDQKCEILQAKINELEENLKYTNERRYKLQDTIGSMEKELQLTKSRMNQVADTDHSRYDIGMPNLLKDIVSQNPTCGSFAFHQHCVNLPIKELECIKRRLQDIATLKLPFDQSNDNQNSWKVLHTAKSLYTFSNRNAFDRLIQLESRRYEILQRQADESYDNLTFLLRLSTTADLQQIGDVNESGENFTLDPNSMYFNKKFLTNLSDTYKDMDDSLTIIKKTMTEVDEAKNSQDE